MFSRLLNLLIVCAIFASAATLDNTRYRHEQNCRSSDCEFLKYNIGNNLNLKINQCENIYDFTCNEHTYSSTNASQRFKKNHREILSDIKKLLKNNYDSNFESVNVEKALYQDCLTLGSSTNEAANEELNNKYKIFKNIINKITSDSKWQNIDRELYKEGFGHAFFDIKVVRDPENVEKNIIMIEPPPRSRLFEMREMLTAAFNETVVNEYIEEHKSDIPYFYQRMALETKENIFEFINTIVEIQDDASKRNKTHHSKKTDIYHWDLKYNKHYDRETAVIDWSASIVEAFQEVGVAITIREPLIVKNEQYFINLFKLLYHWPSEKIVAAVITKTLTENLRYLNWNFADKLSPVKRETFCFYETKLYGASYEALQELDRKGVGLYSNGQFQKKLREVVKNIINSLKTEIYNAKTLTYEQESYLLAELDAITAHIFRDIWGSTAISNYYNGYTTYKNTTYGYINNIINYRKMLKNKEFTSLNDLKPKYLPISVTDLENPTNRFTMYMFLYRTLFTQNSLPMQVYYGDYGVRIASFLYGLLNENKLQRVASQYGKVSKTYPVYTDDNIICIYPMEYILKSKANEAVSNFYGLQIARKAMIKVKSNDEGTQNNSIRITEQKIDQFFYYAFVKSHCELDQFVVNNAVHRNRLFLKDFPRCKDEQYLPYSECELKPFEEISKNIFLI